MDGMGNLLDGVTMDGGAFSGMRHSPDDYSPRNPSAQ
jgi:hypothetical protein